MLEEFQTLKERNICNIWRNISRLTRISKTRVLNMNVILLTQKLKQKQTVAVISK